MLIDPLKIYTYKDYLTFNDNERLEIIEGKIFNMIQAPSRIHQEILSEMLFKIKQYIESNNGSSDVYPAPFDIILKNNDEEIINSKNIVQPDISVICDKNKLTEKGCTGSPDMIVEVISPYNPSNDYVRKLNLYEAFKVKEDWIINPMKKNILVYVLTENGYDAPTSYTFNDKVKVNIYDNLEIDFNSIDL